MPAVLLVKMSSLGDVVHNLPVVSDIIRHVPNAHIDWVVEEAIAEIPTLHPGVRRVIPVALRHWRRRLHMPGTWRQITAMVQALRTRRYDLVLDTQGLLKSAVIAAVAKGPTAGPDWRSAREPLAALLYQRRFSIARDCHAVTRNRELAARALGYALENSVLDYGIRVAANAPMPSGLPARYAVCLHGTAREAKRWPRAHWIALCRVLAARGLVPLLSWGNAAERDEARSMAESIPGAYVLATRLGLRELPAVLGNAELVIGVDTGLMHLAVALGRPTLAIYVDSWPRLSGAFPRDPARALNLGGQGVPPTVDEVMAALAGLGLT